MVQQFQDSYPELQAEPPVMIGDQPLNTVLAKLRLAQLRDLARAFDLTIDMDAPKQQILPALMAAEQRGVFRGRPSSREGEYYLMRAGRTTDDPPLEHAAIDLEPKHVGPYSDMDWQELRRLAKDRLPNMNMYKMDRNEIEAKLEQND